MYRSRLLLVFLVSPLLTACASSPGDDLAPFGDSVRHMMQAQTYRPGDAPPPTLQGDRAASTMEAYRSGSGASRSAGSNMLDIAP